MGHDNGKEEEVEKREEEEIVCLDESFFINDDYQLSRFTFGSHVLQLYCLQSASTDFDLTGQLVWPGAMLMNDYISKNAGLLNGCSIIELGSGVGITGILCSKFCGKVVLTDHNDEVLKILKRNINFQESLRSSDCSAALEAAKLEWGNKDQLGEILQKHNAGFDFILGADICFQQSSIPPLFDTVEQLLRMRGHGNCKFILAYVSRAKMMDSLIVDEANQHKLLMTEVSGTRCAVGILEGVIFEITLQ